MSKKTIRPLKGYSSSGLPTPDQVDRSIEQIAPPTRTPTAKSITADDLRPPAQRTPGRTNKGRVKFTTMLRPDLRTQLETIAQNRATSVADVLEIIVVEYLDTLKG